MISNAEAMAEAIKNMEPALRVAGKTPDFPRFNQVFQSGVYAEPELLQEAIDSSAGLKLDWFKKEQE